MVCFVSLWKIRDRYTVRVSVGSKFKVRVRIKVRVTVVVTVWVLRAVIVWVGGYGCASVGYVLCDIQSYH